MAHRKIMNAVPAVYNWCFRAHASKSSNNTLYYGPFVLLERIHDELNRKYRKKKRKNHLLFPIFRQLVRALITTYPT